MSAPRADAGLGSRAGARASRSAGIVRRLVLAFCRRAAAARARATPGRAGARRASRDRCRRSGRSSRGVRRLGWGAIVRRRRRDRARRARDDASSVGEPRPASSSGARSSPSTLVWATPLTFAAIGGMFSRAQRRREHRPRGDDARGRVLRRARRGQVRTLGDGARRARRSRAAASRSSTPSSRSICAPTRSSAAPRSTSSRSASPATSSSRSTARTARRATCRASPTSTPAHRLPSRAASSAS